jgi:predicted ATP-grasp superfamily ATP-dependent carboligase
MRLPSTYPHGFLDWIGADLPGPWMYVSGLENRPYLVERMARRRPLWGNGCAALLKARNPHVVRAATRAAGLPAPRVHDFFRRPPSGRWLVKPVWGIGPPIHFWCAADARDSPTLAEYVQEFIDGESQSAVYCADSGRAVLLGVTRQLVGLDWLHAAPFRYCGSVGPLQPVPTLRQALEKLGASLARRCGLRGLFGVDGVVRDGAFWPVEVNPRYTASVEVLEYDGGLPAMAWHRAAFDPAALRPDQVAGGPRSQAALFIGKAILFARENLTFPAEGPWADVLRRPLGPEPTPFADIPHPGTPIKAGRPVLTFFARAGAPNACLDSLRRTAGELDHLLFGAGPASA